MKIFEGLLRPKTSNPIDDLNGLVGKNQTIKEATDMTESEATNLDQKDPKKEPGTLDNIQDTDSPEETPSNNIETETEKIDAELKVIERLSLSDVNIGIEMLINWMDDEFQDKDWYKSMSSKEKRAYAIDLLENKKFESKQPQEAAKEEETGIDTSTSEKTSATEEKTPENPPENRDSNIEPNPENPPVTTEEIRTKLSAELNEMIDIVNQKHAQKIEDKEGKDGKFEKVKNFGRKVLRAFKQGDPTMQMVSGTANIMLTLFGGPASGVAQYLRPVISTLSGLMGGRGISSLITEKEIREILAPIAKNDVSPEQEASDIGTLMPIEKQGQLFGLLVESADRKGMQIRSELASQEKADLEMIRKQAADKKILGLDIPTKWKSFKDQFNEMPTWLKVAIPLTMSAVSITASIPALGLTAVSMPIVATAGIINLALTATRTGSNVNSIYYERSNLIEGLQESFEKSTPEEQQRFLDAAHQSQEKNHKNNNIWQYGGAALGLSASVMSILHHQANQPHHPHESQGTSEPTDYSKKTPGYPPSGDQSGQTGTPGLDSSNPTKIGSSGTVEKILPSGAKADYINQANNIHHQPQTNIETHYHSAQPITHERADEVMHNNIARDDYAKINEEIKAGHVKYEDMKLVEDWKHPGHYQIKYYIYDDHGHRQLVGNDLLDRQTDNTGHNMGLPEHNPHSHGGQNVIGGKNIAEEVSTNRNNLINNPSTSQPEASSQGIQQPTEQIQNTQPTITNPPENGTSAQPNNINTIDNNTASSNATNTINTEHIQTPTPEKVDTPPVIHTTTIETDKAGHAVVNTTEHINTPNSPTDQTENTQVSPQSPHSETKVINEVKGNNYYQVDAIVQTNSEHYRQVSDGFDDLIKGKSFTHDSWKHFVDDLIRKVQTARRGDDLPFGLKDDYYEKGKLIAEIRDKALKISDDLKLQGTIKN